MLDIGQAIHFPTASKQGSFELVVESSTNLVDWTPASTNLFAQPTEVLRLTNTFGKACLFRVRSRP